MVYLCTLLLYIIDYIRLVILTMKIKLFLRLKS